MSARPLSYHLLDVFTEQPLSGNPLAVVLDAESLDADQMQAIAREFNLSETVFVLPPSLADVEARLRIFTPTRELPFAGHPTIGTACLLAGLNANPGQGDRLLVLEEGIGPIRVRVQTRAGKAAYAQLSVAQRPQIRALSLRADELAPIFGLQVEDLQPATATAPFVAASCGLEFVLLPLRRVDVLSRVVFSGLVPAALQSRLACESFYLYHLDAESGAVQARMFSAGLGVVEDPATGSAAAALGAYLASVSMAAEGTLRWTITQGVDMQRPSRLDVEVDQAHHTPLAVRVGGHAVCLASGQLYL